MGGVGAPSGERTGEVTAMLIPEEAAGLVILRPGGCDGLGPTRLDGDMGMGNAGLGKARSRQRDRGVCGMEGKRMQGVGGGEGGMCRFLTDAREGGGLGARELRARVFLWFPPEFGRERRGKGKGELGPVQFSSVEFS